MLTTLVLAKTFKTPDLTFLADNHQAFITMDVKALFWLLLFHLDTILRLIIKSPLIKLPLTFSVCIYQ
jgi:hypothetical protein